MEFLYHYYEKERGPFRCLMAEREERAREILRDLREQGDAFAAQRDEGYIPFRREVEALARERFIEKGGYPVRRAPFYMTVGASDYLASWFKEPAYVRVHISQLDTKAISFTYGDMLPTFQPRFGEGYALAGELYTYVEILEVIKKRGLPQVWNEHGRLGPVRYVEAQVWIDIGG